MDGAKERITRRQSLALMAGAAAAALAPGICRAEKQNLRMAISVETLAGANIVDARAAYRVWFREVAHRFGDVTAELVPEIFLPSEELVRDIRQGLLDCYGLTALEFEKVAGLTDPDTMVLEDYLADGIEYVLLVHNSNSFKTVADLHGARIVSHRHRDMVLLPAWLGTMLAADNLGQAEHFFASYELRDSLNLVVLPVFFRRVEGACLSRRNWETALELNPQLGRDLRVLALSPKVIPNGFAFRRSTNAIARQAIVDSMQHIFTGPAGQQIAAFYQSRGFVVRPALVMKGTLELLHQFERVTLQQAHSRKGSS
jgi:hypothetical protein